MKTKALSILAGVAVPLMATTTANAGFVGIKVVQKFLPGGILLPLIDHDNNPATPPVQALVCNVFATFNRPGQDLFLSAAGTPGSPMDIHIVGGGTFFQHPFGDNAGRAPSANLIAVFPSLAYDSFVTIGVKAVGPPPIGQQPDALVLTPGWPGFGPSSLGGTNLGWAVTPNDLQSDPFNPNYISGNGQVLIGQFTTVFNPNISGVSGMFRILVRSNNVATQLNVSFLHPIPAPGALALLGTAGLVGTRRRRRA